MTAADVADGEDALYQDKVGSQKFPDSTPASGRRSVPVNANDSSQTGPRLSSRSGSARWLPTRAQADENQKDGMAAAWLAVTKAIATAYG